MKKSKSLASFLYGVIVFGVLPYISIQLNNRYALPIYDNIYLQLTGLIFAAIGSAIVIHCANVLFFKRKQDNPRFHAPEKFIVEGPYKFVRNPMYLGDFIIILSEFLILGYLLILVYLLIVIFFVEIMVFKEEKDLEKKFGTEYIRYKERVPRWVPSLSHQT
jgi:protein-S-isoprenylcysteine O-methyltransferase Ste14